MKEFPQMQNSSELKLKKCSTKEREVIDMIKEYQVTLLCKSGKYRPVSCIVKCEEINLADKVQKQKVMTKGAEKICIKRGWDGTDLKRFEYTSAKVREYDKEKIEAENKARYEAIKEAKYQSGEWKRPKKDEGK